MNIEKLIFKIVGTSIFAIIYYYLSKLIGFESTVIIALGYIITNQLEIEVE